MTAANSRNRQKNRRSGPKLPKNISRDFIFSARLRTAIDQNREISLIIYRLGERCQVILTAEATPLKLQAADLQWCLEHLIYQPYRRHSSFHQTDQVVMQAQISYLVDHIYGQVQSKDKASSLRSHLWERVKRESGRSYEKGPALSKSYLN